MMIRLNSDWRLRTDERCWIVERRAGTRKVRRGNGTTKNWKAEGYFTQLGNAFRFLMRKRIFLTEGEYGAQALEPLSQAITDITDMIQDNIELLRRIDRAVASGAELPLDGSGYVDTRRLPDSAGRGLARHDFA